MHYIPPQQPFQQYSGQYYQYPQVGQQYVPQVPLPQVAPPQPQTLQPPPQQQPLAQPGQGKKRRKKKAVAVVGSEAGVQPVAPPLGQPIPEAMGQPSVIAPQGLTAAPHQIPTDAPAPVALVKQKKVGRCWKCDVNTHATKNCKVLHYCLVCDSGDHPTVRCPILKVPKPMSFFVGCGNDATLDLQLPDSVYKPQLIASGAPTALVQVSGEGTVTAADIQSLLARMCPGNPTWRWEASPHGEKAFLVGVPTHDDLARIDGMQMSVPKVQAQVLVSTWEHQDIAPAFVMKPVWVHVDGVPDSVKHFLGLWAVGTLIGSTLDVDLYTLRSQGIVRILVAMRDVSVLSRDKRGYLEVVALLHLNGYRFWFRKEADGFKPDSRFRPFFWKDGADSDDSHGAEEKRLEDGSAEDAPGAANMEVDTRPPTHTSGATSATGAQLALTPFNHSPVTDRGREIVARARSQTPHLVASPPRASRTPSPSRVRTFMQGRTRPASSPSSSFAPPGASQPSSASRVVAVELASRAPPSSPPPGGLLPRGPVLEEEAAGDAALLRHQGEARGGVASAEAAPCTPTAVTLPRPSRGIDAGRGVAVATSPSVDA
nr:uncharacterized protein LOC127312198 [Lolium perenne]